jgi:hypothetical protein
MAQVVVVTLKVQVLWVSKTAVNAYWLRMLVENCWSGRRALPLFKGQMLGSFMSQPGMLELERLSAERALKPVAGL